MHIKSELLLQISYSLDWLKCSCSVAMNLLQKHHSHFDSFSQCFEAVMFMFRSFLSQVWLDLLKPTLKQIRRKYLSNSFQPLHHLAECISSFLCPSLPL